MSASDPALAAAERAWHATGAGGDDAVAGAREALKPIQAALDDWYQKYLAVPAGPGATLRSETVCMDALAEIGLLAGWKAPD